MTWPSESNEIWLKSETLGDTVTPAIQDLDVIFISSLKNLSEAAIFLRIRRTPHCAPLCSQVQSDTRFQSLLCRSSLLSYGAFQLHCVLLCILYMAWFHQWSECLRFHDLSDVALPQKQLFLTRSQTEMPAIHHRQLRSRQLSRYSWLHQPPTHSVSCVNRLSSSPFYKIV